MQNPWPDSGSGPAPAQPPERCCLFRAQEALERESVCHGARKEGLAVPGTPAPSMHLDPNHVLGASVPAGCVLTATLPTPAVGGLQPVRELGPAGGPQSGRGCAMQMTGDLVILSA